MSFVSYAQNFEDVMLWRALKHVQNGVYVDVGAQHPVVDSVSKAFYEHGWHGIHIEPVPAYAELLRKDRPDETVLQVALADVEGMLELNVIPDTGLSTAVDEYAQLHRIERGYVPQRIQVPVLTLKTATESLMGKDVHWLKIDVEGLEEQVLKGWDSQVLRPWVMVVEATIPSSPETGYTSWEPVLTAAEYQFVYFDGLNRFYVAREHAELAEAFSSPPNVFDRVELSGLASSTLCQGLIAAHQASEQASAAQINAANEHNTQLQAHAQWLQNEWDAANNHNTQLQTHAQWLQNGWDTARQRIEELSRSMGQLEAQLASDQQRNGHLVSELKAANEHNTQLQAHTQWLQNEFNAANEHNARLQAHAQWLQGNLDEANAKVHELSQEHQRIYASTFWRLTWPLRKTMQIAKWSLALPARIIEWAIRLPKRMAKLLLVWAMRKSLNNPSIKNRALSKLAKYPRLKQHLRLLATRSGLIAGGNMTSRAGHSFSFESQSAVATTYSSNMQEESIDTLSPRAARIYAELKKSIDTRNN
ncbi:FkbM family methyltransferase [Methylobacter sp. Wu1]|uniref:FkbM family methyltransferase n=1 Tax=Methylobacter sp. Wu1 TaxID=3119359 RepID=UPI002F958A28